MADELARINLLTDARATLETITEDGTPGIATDYSHRLGWLSGGSFRWGAMRDTDERFASVTVSNAVSGLLKTDGLKKIVSSDIFSEVAGLGYASNLSVSDLSNGVYPLAGASGRLANGSLSEDVTSIKSAKPLTLNGATRPAWALWDAPIQLSNQSAIYTIAATGGDQVGFARNFYTAVDGFQKAIASYTGKGYPTQFHLDDNGRLRFFASQTDPVAGSTVSDLTMRFEVNRFGAILCRESEPVISGITASTAGLSYSNSTTPTSIIAEGAKTIAAGRWGAAGTVWTALFMGAIQWNNAQTIRFEVLLGATVIADSGAVSMLSISSGSIWSLTLYGTLRTVGASGTLQIDGVFRCTDSGGLVSIKGFSLSTPSPVAIDTTVSNTFNVRATAGTASADNILATRTFHFYGD